MPIVEPEVLVDGVHTLADATGKKSPVQASLARVAGIAFLSGGQGNELATH